MKVKTKYIIGITSASILATIGFIIFGLYLMEEEDRYGDLVYFNQKVETGNLIFRYNDTTKLNDYGIIEKSFGKVYIWDNQNTLKRNLYEWAEKGKGGRVKVFRAKTSGFDINSLENEIYTYLRDSDQIEFVIEN